MTRRLGSATSVQIRLSGGGGDGQRLYQCALLSSICLLRLSNDRLDV